MLIRLSARCSPDKVASPGFQALRGRKSFWVHLRSQLLFLSLGSLKVGGEGCHNMCLSKSQFYHLQGPFHKGTLLGDERVFALWSEVDGAQGCPDAPQDCLVLLPEGLKPFCDSLSIGDNFILGDHRHPSNQTALLLTQSFLPVCDLLLVFGRFTSVNVKIADEPFSTLHFDIQKFNASILLFSIPGFNVASVYLLSSRTPSMKHSVPVFGKKLLFGRNYPLPQIAH